jgi:molybdopterin converting factor small subunit
VELFGVARMVAHTTQVPLVLCARATLVDVYAALVEKLPALRGRVISAGEPRLMEGYTCNINGREFVRTSETPVHAGDSLMIFSADAGG